MDSAGSLDVLQLVMMVVLREARGFKYDPDTKTFHNAAVVKDGQPHPFVRFRSWLKGVVLIKIREVRKFAARGGTLRPDDSSRDDIPDTAPQPDEAADEASELAFRQALLDQALVRLRESYRGSGRNVDLFEDVSLRGISYAEAAAAYAVSEVHARQMVHTLKPRLKDILSELLRADR